MKKQNRHSPRSVFTSERARRFTFHWDSVKEFSGRIQFLNCSSVLFLSPKHALNQLMKSECTNVCRPLGRVWDWGDHALLQDRKGEEWSDLVKIKSSTLFFYWINIHVQIWMCKYIYTYIFSYIIYITYYIYSCLCNISMCVYIFSLDNNHPISLLQFTMKFCEVIGTLYFHFLFSPF